MLQNTSFVGLRRCWSAFSLPVVNADSPSRTNSEKNNARSATSHILHKTDTSHLTALRGIAAIVVYNWHMLLPFWPNLLQPYSNPKESSVFQFPVIRLIVAGPSAVCFYAVLAGYVQSLGPLSTPPDQPFLYQCRRVLRSVARRTAFILASSILVTVFAAAAVYWGNLYRFADLGDVPSFLHDMFPVQQPTLAAQLRDWLSFNSLLVTGIWRGTGWEVPKSNYGTHLWTVPSDLRASLLLMPFLSCCHMLSPQLRTLLAAAGVVTMRVVFPDYGAGQIAALTYLGATLACLTTSQIDGLKDIVLGALQKLSAPLTALSVYGASLPLASRETVASKNINPLFYIPSFPIYNLIGAPLLSSIMIATPPSSVRRFLTRKRLQDFGKISYSFYLVHQIIVHLIGHPAVMYLRDRHNVPVVSAVVIVGASLFPVVWKTATIFDRYVTQPLRRFIDRCI